jgi:hypothetical protein
MHLRLNVAPPWHQHVRRWLEAQVTGGPHEESNGAALRRMAAALDAYFTAVAAGRRSQRWVYELEVVGPECIHIVDHEHAPADAMVEVRFGIALPASQLARPESAQWLVPGLVSFIAHETAHLLQSHPFTEARWRASWGAQQTPHAHPSSVQAESHAALLEHCARVAIAPPGVVDIKRSLAYFWRDEPAWYRRRLERLRHLGFEAVYERLFTALRQAQGDAFVYAHDEATMESLFGLCLAAGRRPDTDVRRVHISARERSAARRLIRQLAALGTPIYWLVPASERRVPTVRDLPLEDLKHLLGDPLPHR